MKSQNLTRGWEAQRWRKTDMGNHHVNMGKILGYHHIMFILPSADVAFCYRMLSAATAHEFEPSVQHSRHPTFQPWIPVQVVIVWTSLVHLCLSGSGSVQWWQDWSDWSHPWSRCLGRCNFWRPVVLGQFRAYWCCPCGPLLQQAQ